MSRASILLLLLAGLNPVPGLQLSVAATTLHPRIVADSNRDGRVDDLDLPHRHQWTAEHGAIFLPNIGDRFSRCAVADLRGVPLSDGELAGCDDASGDLLLTPELAAPLKTYPIQGLSDVAVGRILTQPAAASNRVRVFWRHGDGANSSADWTLTRPELSFNATALSRGLSLAVDARELVTDSSTWDGAIRVVFQVVDGQQSADDHVAMKQAPVLLHHPLQRPELLLSVETDRAVSPWQPRFLQALSDAVGRLETPLPLEMLNNSNEVWAQDFMEPAYASMPGRDGPVSLRVLLRSPQSTRANGRRVFAELRGNGVGGWQPETGESGFGWEEINSGGNMETTPPYVSRSGVSYPHGRVLLGKHFDKYPAKSLVTFLESQGAQPPLFLEAGWLAVGHVDEMVQLLPYENDLGFTLAVPDTNAALEVLRLAAGSGHGSAPLVSYNGSMAPDGDTLFLDVTLRNRTVDSLLSDEGLLQTNQYAQEHLDGNLALLLRDMPLAPSDVLRVPTLWKDVTYPWPRRADGVPARLHRARPGQKQLQSLFPHVVNGVVLGHDYIAPKPWGPSINGRDILETAVVSVFARANMTVWFLDDYMSHHVRGGEIHCGTNTLRETGVEWWKGSRRTMDWRRPLELPA